MTNTIIETPIAARVDMLDWPGLRSQLDDRGFAITDSLLSGTECEALADLFDGGRFRSTIDMARHRSARLGGDGGVPARPR
jgi:hypothetical protein